MILAVGGVIIGTLIVTTSKWDSEILIALAALAGPIIVDHYRSKAGKEEEKKSQAELLELRNRNSELQAKLQELE